MSEKINYQRRRLLGTAAITIATAQLGLFNSANAQSGESKPAALAPALLKPEPNRSFSSLKQIDAGLLSVGYAAAGICKGCPRSRQLLTRVGLDRETDNF